MKNFLEFSRQLDEKQIQYGKNANYGQVVFFAGGAGSGKGFAISNFIDSSKFKIRDVDDLKTKMARMPGMVRKYPEITNLVKDLKNPENVRRLHEIATLEKIPEKQLMSWISGMTSPDTLPNILFDMTFKSLKNATELIPPLLSVGYRPENIHITWVLTDYTVAVERNKKRERVVPDDIMLQTHSGAALTMNELLSGELPSTFNGSFTIILNNPEAITYYEPLVPVYDKKDKLSPTVNKNSQVVDHRGVPITKKVIKDFTYITLKKAGQPLVSFVEMDKQIREKVIGWVINNAPRTDEILRAYAVR